MWSSNRALIISLGSSSESVLHQQISWLHHYVQVLHHATHQHDLLRNGPKISSSSITGTNGFTCTPLIWKPLTPSLHVHNSSLKAAALLQPKKIDKACLIVLRLTGFFVFLKDDKIEVVSFSTSSTIHELWVMFLFTFETCSRSSKRRRAQSK